MNLFHFHNPSLEPHASCQGRLSGIRLWAGLFGAPAAWIVQFSLSEPLAANACYPYQAPLSAPIWQGLPAMLTAISITCFAAALLSGFAAWSSWRQYIEKDSSIKNGEGRNRFLVKLSALSSFIFIVAIIFNICAVFLAPPCSPWF